MPSFQPYQDLPPIVDEESFGNTQFRTDTPYMATNYNWAALDPSLEQSRYVHDYRMYPPVKNLQTMQDHLVELENSANGFGHLAPLQIPGQQFSRLDIHSLWGEQHQNVRYLSPSGYLGGSLSSSDSSPSERAFSPDVARQYATPSVYSYFNGSSFHSPAAEISYMGNGSTLSQPTHFVGGLASPSPSHSSAACNPRALQYTPDTSMEDDHSDEDTIRVKTTGPEDIILLPETTSPADSGLGRSVDDELSEYAPESDNDTEYVPARAGRKQSMNARRPSFMRGPRRQKSLQTPTTIDPKNRVSKPANRKKTDARVNKNGLTKAEKEAAKMFTCTFSHYGCDAKFASKNEWKRHVSSQHLQLGFYRCDVGSCNLGLHQHNGSSRTYNDFNRKDLFTQHHRRMHTPWGNPKEGTKRQWDEFEEGLEAIRKRCWRVRREPPARSGCGFCGRIFEEDDELGNSNGVVNGIGKGKDKSHHVHQNSWEERMEHVGKHIEQADWDRAAEREDEDLTAWALREGIVKEHAGMGVWLVGTEPGEGRMGGGEGRRRSGRRATVDQNFVVAGEEDDDDDEEQDAQGEDE